MILNENIKSTINHIITLGNSIPSFFLEQDLDMFIIKCVSKLGKNSIEKSKVINSFKKIFQYYENLKEIKLTIKEQSIDKFKCHGNEEINLKDKSSYYNEILQNLEMFLNSGYDFEKDDLDDLISSIENTPFYLIKIKLIEMKKDYLNCLNVFLLNLDKFESRKIFEWINNTFSLLNKKENNGLVEEDKENLQKAILDKLPKLSELSIDKTMKIVDNWFSNEHKMNIIKKLEVVPEVQYQYLEKILSEKLGKNNENKVENLNERKNSFQINPQDKDLGELVLLEIKLLIELNRKEEILSTIKERISYYPLKNLLEICLSNKILNDLIYLYEITGDSKNAFSINNKRINNKF